jgi:hypothetical protein
MFAMLPRDPPAPVRGIPHLGTMPTGAVFVSFDTPVSAFGSTRWSCEKYFDRDTEGLKAESTHLSVEEVTPWVTRCVSAQTIEPSKAIHGEENGARGRRELGLKRQT